MGNLSKSTINNVICVPSGSVGHGRLHDHHLHSIDVKEVMSFPTEKSSRELNAHYRDLYSIPT